MDGVLDRPIWEEKKWTQFLVIPLPMKGNLRRCQNYRTISLEIHPSKMLLRVILERLKTKADELLAALKTDDIDHFAGSNIDLLDQDLTNKLMQSTGSFGMEVSTDKKYKLYNALVVSVLLYSCEIWILLVATERKIQAFEIKCMGRPLGITCREHKKNEYVRKDVHHNITWPAATTLSNCQETQAAVVRPGDMTRQPAKDSPAGHSVRRTLSRKTEKVLTGQHCRMDFG
ncbi:hypothetical protein Bbelb_117050 [Branchiostoma belcheri]|nr:hypothetical protein Bbelb_117050 [Branchiostoma belcheri]